LVDEVGLTHLHVFPYSSRPGTPAAKMPQLSGTLVKERAARLRAKGEAVMTAYLDAQIGQTVSVLVEQDGQGHCQHYLPVRIEGDVAPGSIQEVRITERAGSHLIGKLAA